MKIIILFLIPIISWGNTMPPNNRYPLSGTQLTATSNGAGTFTYTPPNEIQYRKLTWENYNTVSYSKFKSAETATKIDMQYDTKNDSIISIKVNCHFVKKDSWVLAGYKNDYILNHEQRHFDIAYICASRLAGLLADVRDAKQADIIFDRCMDEERAMQSLYDKETNFSRNVNGQKEWDDLIASKLHR